MIPITQSRSTLCYFAQCEPYFEELAVELEELTQQDNKKRFKLSLHLVKFTFLTMKLDVLVFGDFMV